MICSTARLKELLIEVLMLEGHEPESIDDDAPLFGGGLDLDSVDALEIVLALKAEYGLDITAGDENNKKIFKSVSSLADFVNKQTN